MVYTPKFLALILRGAFGGFRDDNFQPVWAADTHYTTSTDGDFMTIVVSGGVGGTGASKDLPTGNQLATNTFSKIIIRSRQSVGTETWKIQVLFTDLSTQEITISSVVQSEFQIVSATLTAAKTVKTIRILDSAGSGSGTIVVDWVYITTLTHLDVTKYVRSFDTKEHLGWQTGQTTVELQDENGSFWGNTPALSGSGLISMSDILMLYVLSDSTENSGILRRAWGGPITQIDKTSTRETSSKRTSMLTSVQWNKALESVEDYAFHGAQSDTDILTKAGAPIGLITRVNTGFINPAVSGWNLATDITSYTSVNASFQWNQIDVARALIDLSDYSALQIGGLGIDFFVTHSEVFRWKQIGATGAYPTGWGTVPSFTDSDWLSLNLRNQIFDLKTALTVIGQTSTPQDGDFYTENYAASWVADLHVASFTDDADSQVGAKSIKILETAALVAANTCTAHVVITTVNPNKLGSKSYQPYLKVRLKKGSNVQGGAGNVPSITLSDGGGTNSITLNLGATLDGNGWVSFVAPILDASQPPAGTAWVAAGTGFNTDFTKFSVTFFNNNTSDANSFMKIDGLAITGYTAETAVDGRTGTGESQYGRRELVVFDQAVRQVTVPTSTDKLGPGIRQVARMELVKWWNPIVQGQMIGDADPTNNFLALHPGQTIQVTSPHHNYTSKNLRILSIGHHWSTPDTNIRSTIEVTDFFKATEVRTPGDIFRELARFSGLSQADVEQAKWQALYSYGGLIPTIYQYTSDNDQTGTFIS